MEKCKTCNEIPYWTLESSTDRIMVRFDCRCSQERIEFYKVAPLIYRAMKAKAV